MNDQSHEGESTPDHAVDIADESARFGEALLFRLVARGEQESVLVDRGGSVWRIRIAAVSHTLLWTLGMLL